MKLKMVKQLLKIKKTYYKKILRSYKMVLKKIIKIIIADIYYRYYMIFVSKKNPTVKVMTVDETIEKMITSNDSLVRFGDGELLMIRGGNIIFQNMNEKLSHELSDIIGYKYDGLIVAVQDIFNGLDMYVSKSKKHWKDHFLFYNKYYKKYCNKERIYASTSFSRAYITISDKSQCNKWFTNIKKIWEGKKVVVVEGAATHNGVGNDLLNNCQSIKRIICPSKNAYASFDIIKSKCLTFSKDNLFLVSLGPAAKPLVRDLYLEGYRAIDIGQLDMEYEMYLAEAKEKNDIDIKKHRVLTLQENLKAGYNEYLNQIVETIE